MRMIERLDPGGFVRVGLCPFDGELHERYRAIMEAVEPLPMRSDSKGLWTKTREYAAAMADVRRAVRRHRIDLIHANSFRSALICGPVGRLAGVPVIWHMHDILKPKRLNRLLVRLCSRMATAIVGPSEATCRGMLALSAQPSRMNKIHNGIALNALAEGSPGDGNPLAELPDGAPAVVMVGQITEWKGQHVLLEAVGSILESVPEARVFFVGEGLYPWDKVYEAGLKNTAGERGLDAHVTWLGFRKDVPAIMRRADVVVHCSIRPDPLPTVIVEGMALGRVVVASHIGGVPEMVVDGETGHIYPPGDSKALAARVIEVLSDPDRAREMGHKARRRIGESFTIEKNVASILGLYRRVLPDHPVWTRAGPAGGSSGQ